MTKAERIFNDTYRQCRIYVKHWGVQKENGKTVGFNSLETEDVTCKRTWNAIQKCIDKEIKHLEFHFNHNFISEEEYRFYSNALEMVQGTLDNTIRSYENF